MESLIGRKDGGQEIFVVAIGFAQEAFGSVAVHGAAQLALGYAQQNFYRGLAARLYAPIDGTQRIDRVEWVPSAKSDSMSLVKQRCSALPKL